ncbi:MAG TPA: FliH/SctL family protein [Marmoricola sp.]|nr:FliH/SctL family protein [Marmoricola sp.]
MSSSFEPGVVRPRSHGAPVEEVEPVRLSTPELRTGVWTRFGGSSVLGDAVTEETLSALAESTRNAARSQGYAVGWADGQRAAREQARVEAEVAEQARVEAEQQREREHRAAIAALELAAVRIHDAVEGMSARVEEQASTLAWDLTRELVGLELRSVTGPDVVRRALQLAPTEAIVKLHLHPDHVSDLTAADLAELADHGVSVAGDPSLAWGDALAETADHVIDLRVRTALDRLREVLQ